MSSSFQIFPHFSGWPSQKVYFLENMAVKQDKQDPRQDQDRRQELQQELQQDLQQDFEKYVVITKEKDVQINHICPICSTRFCMTFNQDEEEWIFNDCTELDGVAYHFPLCYEEVLKRD